MSQTATVAGAKPQKLKLRELLPLLRKRRVALMLVLGFSSGLPFFLTAATLGLWLRESGTSLKAIGFISWVGLAYSFKFLWSPIVDRVSLPLLGRLGRRRGWMLLTQIVLAASLLAMALIGPGGGLVMLGAAALATAFASATQDIAIDAFRIESARDDEELAIFSSAFQLGYRLAVLVSDTLIFYPATFLGWPAAYGMMAVLMGVGMYGTFSMPEPPRADVVLNAQKPLWSPLGFIDAVIGPFVQFFKNYGFVALLMLLMIILYRLPEFIMGPMATPFYHDLGLSKVFIANIRLSAGLPGTIAGLAVGGLISASLGHVRGLIVSGLLEVVAIASFALLGIFGASPGLFAFVMFFDNFGVGAAGVALVVYMSSLTSLGYTATQYALLSSAYTWVGKTLKGFTGLAVEGLQAQGHSLMESYAIFFAGAGALGLPAVALCAWLGVIQARRRAHPSELSAPSS